MQVVLIGAEREENLSTRYLAAALGRAGHAATLVPFADMVELEEAVRRTLAAAPGVVGLSLILFLPLR